MSHPKLGILLGLVLLAVLGGCRTNDPGTEPAAAAPSKPIKTPLEAKAEDVAAFDAFIATRPTPEAFRLRYPAIKLVLPGDIATRELRLDRSRYFADLDEQQRIRGGRFQ